MRSLCQPVAPGHLGARPVGGGPGAVRGVPGGRGARRTSAVARSGVEPPALDVPPARPRPARGSKPEVALLGQARTGATAQRGPRTRRASLIQRGRAPCARRARYTVHHQGLGSTASSVAGRPTPRPARPTASHSGNVGRRRRRAMYTPCGALLCQHAQGRGRPLREVEHSGRPRRACALPTSHPPAPAVAGQQELTGLLAAQPLTLRQDRRGRPLADHPAEARHGK